MSIDNKQFLFFPNGDFGVFSELGSFVIFSEREFRYYFRTGIRQDGVGDLTGIYSFDIEY